MAYHDLEGAVFPPARFNVSPLQIQHSRPAVFPLNISGPPSLGPWHQSDVCSHILLLPPHSPTQHPPSGRHLIILTHGVFGTRHDWDHWMDTWKAHSAATGASPSYFDSYILILDFKGITLKGIHVLAKSGIKQIETFLSQHQGVFTHFSLVGHSLGGVVNKAIICMRPACHHFRFLKPRNFVALATPHLGARRFDHQLVEGVAQVVYFPMTQTGKDFLQLDSKRNLIQVALELPMPFPILCTDFAGHLQGLGSLFQQTAALRSLPKSKVSRFCVHQQM